MVKLNLESSYLCSARGDFPVTIRSNRISPWGSTLAARASCSRPLLDKVVLFGPPSIFAFHFEHPSRLDHCSPPPLQNYRSSMYRSKSACSMLPNARLFLLPPNKDMNRYTTIVMYPAVYRIQTHLNLNTVKQLTARVFLLV